MRAGGGRRGIGRRRAAGRFPPPAELAALATALVACGAPAPRVAPNPADPCFAGESALGAEATLADRAGSYRLLLVAQEGPRAGDSTHAELELRAASGDRGTSGGEAGTQRTLRGWTDVKLADVGARTSGPVDARDSTAPGVLVLEARATDGSARITLRLGATLNRSDLLLTEGTFTVLRVESVTPAGFAGTWRTGPFAPEASGSFCARLRQ